MAREQDRLDAKRGRTAAAVPPAAKSEDKSSWLKLTELSPGLRWSVFLIVTIVLFGMVKYFGLWPSKESATALYSLSLQSASEWLWDHWLLVGLFIGAAFILINAYGGDLKNEWLAVFWVAAGLLLVAVPVGIFVRDGFKEAPICPSLTTSFGYCDVTTAWSLYFTSASTADNGKKPCYGPTSLVKHDEKMANGTRWYRFRAETGKVEAWHVLVPADEQCPDTAPPRPR